MKWTIEFILLAIGTRNIDGRARKRFDAVRNHFHTIALGRNITKKYGIGLKIKRQFQLPDIVIAIELPILSFRSSQYITSNI